MVFPPLSACSQCSHLHFFFFFHLPLTKTKQWFPSSFKWKVSARSMTLPPEGQVAGYLRCVKLRKVQRPSAGTLLLHCAHGAMWLLPGHGRAYPKPHSFQFKCSLVFHSTAKEFLDFLCFCVSWLSPVVLHKIRLHLLFCVSSSYRNDGDVFFLSFYALSLAKSTSTVRIRLELSVEPGSTSQLLESQAWTAAGTDLPPEPNGQCQQCVGLCHQVFSAHIYFKTG